MKVKNIYEPSLMVDVTFLWDGSFLELSEWFKKKHAETKDDFHILSGAVTDYTDENGAKHYIVWVEEKRDFYTLLHESVHLVKRIMVHRDIPFNDKNDELIAYYLTFWFRKLWRAMNV